MSSLFLKRLTLHGFKAFCDKTVIDFSNGVGAFAGPNGCGKSNLIDALRWVMGEKKFSDLRGNRMEDLIFYGGDGEKASNFGEVSLVLNNSTKILPIDYLEVKITRRVYRSGESECFINNTPCRLKDITQLLFSTIGKSGYSIIAQGKVEEIASGNAESRRMVVEEVAGIATFREKKREYQRRIEASKQNLSRLDDILKTLGTQQKHLSKQAENSVMFFSLRSQLKDWQIESEKLNYHKIESTVKKQNEKLARLKKQGNEIEKSIANCRLQKKKQEELIQVSRETILRLEKEKMERSSQNIINLEKVKMHEKLIISAQRSCVETRNALVSKQQQKNDLENALETLQKQRGEISQALEVAKKENETHHSNKQRLHDQEQQLKKEKKLLEQKKKEASQQVEQWGKEIETTTQRILEELKSATAGKGGAKTALKNLDSADKQRIVRFLETAESSEAELFELLSNPVAENLKLAKQQLQNYFQDTAVLRKGYDTQQKLFKPLLTVYEQRLAIVSSIEEKKKLLQMYGKQEKEIEKGIADNSKQVFELKNLLYRNSLDQQKLKQEDSQLRTKLQLTKTNIEENTDQAKKMQTKLDGDERKLESLMEEKKQVLDEGKTQRGHEEEIEKKIIDEKNNSRRIYAKLAETENQLNSLSTEEYSKRNEFTALHHQIQLLHNDLEHLKKNVSTLHGENIEKLIKERPANLNIKESVVEKKIQQLKAGIEKRGQINPLAEEEYREIKQKIGKLREEREDALKSIDDLYSLCSDLEQKSKITFEKVFSLVDQHFGDFIGELFPGSKGNLVLTQPETPLTSGIDIVAELRGKKIRKMHLFSGGEKTLIALAFIFALFLTRRTPFCIMDEVDAALDNENILRFISLLKKYSDQTQFVVVSHNQSTFSVIDYIYGVSMQSGKSQVFSLKIPTTLQPI